MGLMRSLARFWADTSGSVLSLSLTLMGGQPGGGNPGNSSSENLTDESGNILTDESGNNLMSSGA